MSGPRFAIAIRALRTKGSRTVNSHAGSLGFDLAATEWFRDTNTNRYGVRLAVPIFQRKFGMI